MYVGETIYKDVDTTMIKNKFDRLTSTWAEMVAKVTKDIKSSRTKQQLDASSHLSGYMGQIKSDIRLLAKAACKGDIYVRGSVNIGETSNVAKFDYSSGLFEYQPIAEKAEKIIAQINDFYFYSLKGLTSADEKDKLLKEWAGIDDLFKEWQSLVEKQIGK